jgi:hypothetical protein
MLVSNLLLAVDPSISQLSCVKIIQVDVKLNPSLVTNSQRTSIVHSMFQKQKGEYLEGTNSC